MKEIQIGDQTIRLRATTPALLYYKQEFKRDLVGDLLKMFQSMVGINALQNSVQGGGDVDTQNLDLGALDSVLVLQLVWAMAKADAFGKEFPSFEYWVHSLEEFNVFDASILKSVIEEATNGFFRKGAGQKFIAPSARL